MEFFERLKDYCSILAPSGMEKPMRKRIIEDIKDSGAEWRVDPNGNLIVFKKGRARRDKKLVVAAHMDEVGFMASYIDEEGYVRIENVGGIDRRVVSGRRIMFCGSNLVGVVASKAIHIQTKEEIGKCEPINEMRVDIGCYDRESAEKRVRIGDCATFCPNYEEFGNELIKSKAIDDRFGCAVMVELINSDLEYDTYFAFDTCEEIGCDGAKEVCYQLNPDIAVILESTTAGDICGTPAEKAACTVHGGAVISHMDNSTVYDKELVKLAMELGKEKGIPCQLKNTVAGGNEARAYQREACGARVLAISAPTRYIHSACSVAAKEDLTAVAAMTKTIIERKF